MKKFLFLTGMILAMGAFQSLKAQTFSRVVTVDIDTFINGTVMQIGVIYKVPPHKVFKVSYLGKNITYTNTGYTILNQNNAIFLNSFPLSDNSFFNSNKEQEGIWLKSGDEIRINSQNNGALNFNIKVFLSGIEYDVP
jgi:hypothetical protein